ncbi:MAG: hypoxanthine-guanine phosphoribosyltransferase [Methylococcales bacterium]
MLEEIKRVRTEAELLYSEDEVENSIARMAEEIHETLVDRNPILLCVLNGGIIPTARLMAQIHFPFNLDSIHASRYHGKTRGEKLVWGHKPTIPLKGRTILLVDDVLDEGITLFEINKFCLAKGAEAVYSAVVVNKKLSEDKPFDVDFVGVETDNRYLFGYGMDYKGYLRNAPGIFACKEDNHST